MYPYFDVRDLSVERLLKEWLWLCPGNRRLVAVDAFADLFLEDGERAVVRLETTNGKLDRIADSVAEFLKSTQDINIRKDWFSEDVALSLAEQGFNPSKGQCIGYKTPIVFKESTGDASNVYIAELYEYVSFLGDLHFQMRYVPDGGQVRLIIGGEPKKGP